MTHAQFATLKPSLRYHATNGHVDADGLTAIADLLVSQPWAEENHERTAEKLAALAMDHPRNHWSIGYVEAELLEMRGERAEVLH